MAEAEQPRENPRESMPKRQSFRSKGWQVSNIEKWGETQKSAFVPLTEHDESAVILNCYQPGQHDEMHAHPKEEHVFIVWKGKLHLTGVEDGEDVTLGPGEFVHIDAGWSTTIGSTTRGRIPRSIASSAPCPCEAAEAAHRVLRRVRTRQAGSGCEKPVGFREDSKGAGLHGPAPF